MTNSKEVKAGLFVIFGMAALMVLVVLGTSTVNISSSEYKLIARFDNIGGLKPNAPVTLAGVKIGRVFNISIDKKDYDAIVTLSIGKDYNNLPSDTSASVYSRGIMGESYIELDLGGDTSALQPGDELRFCQSALILEKIIGQFLFKTVEEK